MTKILNTWRSDNQKKVYYDLDTELYRNGDYAAYAESKVSIIYTYKNVAISNLAGFKKALVDQLASGTPPHPSDKPGLFLYNRSVEDKERGLKLIKQKKE